MRFLPLIWSGIWRKPGRSILIFLQVSVAFALFGVLQGMKTGVDELISRARADLLLVHGSLSLIDPLPLGLLEQIKSVPGVKAVVPVELFGGIYQQPTQQIGIVAIRPDDDWLSAFTYTVAPDQAAAFAADANRHAGPAIRRGQVRLESRRPDSADHQHGTEGRLDDLVVRHRGHLHGQRRRRRQRCHPDPVRLLRRSAGARQRHRSVTSTPPSSTRGRLRRVADAIDRRFANSTNATKTESLRELAQMQLQSIGDLNFLIRAVVSAVLVALFFATTTMLMQSVRERTPELAVLKTLGFANSTLFLFIVAEAAFVCVIAAGFGLALALVAFPFASKFVPGLSMPAPVVAIGLGCAALVALISASAPAIRAARLNIVAALGSR